MNDWLGEKASQTAGWHGPQRESGETVGHQSGRMIMQILEGARHHDYDRSMDNGGVYTNEELQHMRRVVSYCRRHLAQEQRNTGDVNSREYQSLKNWGHDS
ncbi:hypothetical protein PENANT_c011G02635 [Penicillium antarcticum]|uniref:Uncharacterized protein n=2 Tax=Penicillium antarcticum TaxID=416450 RepID=A0A1V6Q7B3_9EURO|nr:hypothetical protein PENANT_c011G02635 [Penicillium antarcticum]